jgi:hypothetical protein
MLSEKTKVTPAEYARAIYAGWHKEDTVCYTDRLGRLQHYPDRQTILYLPGRAGIIGSGACEQRWISYDRGEADVCRADAERLRREVESAVTIEDAEAVVTQFYLGA